MASQVVSTCDFVSGQMTRLSLHESELCSFTDQQVAAVERLVQEKNDMMNAQNKLCEVQILEYLNVFKHEKWVRTAYCN